MSRFLIQWISGKRRWFVVDSKSDGPPVADFASLLEAETYVIERGSRSER